MDGIEADRAAGVFMDEIACNPPGDEKAIFVKESGFAISSRKAVLESLEAAFGASTGATRRWSSPGSPIQSSRPSGSANSVRQ